MDTFIIALNGMVYEFDADQMLEVMDTLDSMAISVHSE